MSKHLSIPTTRLICVGSARALTNSLEIGNRYEDEVGGPKYNA